MIHELNSRAIAVDVPENSHGFKLAYYSGVTYLWYLVPPLRGYSSKELPEGDWQILGKASELTEEQAAGVVKKDEDGYWINYNWKSWHSNSTEDTALESFQSLLASKNIDPLKVIILIKQ
jgi:hypothetical protein